MSPGQPPVSTTAPYVDMSGINKVSHRYGGISDAAFLAPAKRVPVSSPKERNFLTLQINRNNNNNTITANHNHSHMHIPLAFAHKPVITTLKPVEEAEGPYMKMDGVMAEDWMHSETSPSQMLSSPMQEDICQTNGPPGKSPHPPDDNTDDTIRFSVSAEYDINGKQTAQSDNR